MMGSNGSLFVNDSEQVHIPALKVTPVDTTAVGLIKGMSDVEAAKFASKVAGITVTKEGAQTSLPGIQEVRKFGQIN